MLAAQENLFVAAAEAAVGPAAAKEVGKGLRLAFYRPSLDLPARLAAFFGGGCAPLRAGLVALLGLLALGLLGCAQLVEVAGPTATPEVVVLREEPAGPQAPLRSSRLVPRERFESLQIPTLTPEPTEEEMAEQVQIVVATPTPAWSESIGTRDAGGGGLPDRADGGADPGNAVERTAVSDLDNGAGGEGGRFGEEVVPPLEDARGTQIVAQDPALARKVLLRQHCLAAVQGRFVEYEPFMNRHRDFNFAVARELVSKFLENNVDCVRVAGWKSGIAERPVCTSIEMPLSYPEGARLKVPSELRNPGRVQLTVGDTAKVDGHVVVHFDRLPYSDYPGCWFYHAYEKVWAWEEFINGRSQEPVGGIDWPDFPECWEALAPELAGRKGYILDHDRVADAVETVRREGPERCDDENWDARARERPAKGCPEPLDGYTGLRPDGSLLIHWVAAPPQYYACWFLTAEGTWQRYARY